MATIALVFSVTGTGWAVTQLPRNSVGPWQIKPSSVTSVKVKNGSLRAIDFAAGQLPRGETGATGARGPSDAYVNLTGGVALQQTSTVVNESQTLPAGSYVSLARINVVGDATSVSLGASCTLTPDFLQTGAIAAGTREALTLVGSQVLREPGTVNVSCRRQGGTPLTLESVHLTVIRVETLTQPTEGVG